MNYKQDMPRKGGYDPISWARNVPLKGINSKFYVML